MNIKSNIVIEIEKSGRVYSYVMPIGAPYGEAHDVAFEVASEIIKMSQKAIDQYNENKAPRHQDIDDANVKPGE